jgi:hypothetical protein
MMASLPNGTVECVFIFIPHLLFAHICAFGLTHSYSRGVMAAISTASITSALTTLKHEHMILDRIIYRNHNQHRRTLYYQRMRGVARLLPRVHDALAAVVDAQKNNDQARLATEAIHSVTELWLAILKCIR